MLPAPLRLTDAAVHRVKNLLEQRGKPSVGIRIGVSTKGCSGLKYTIEYADEHKPYEEVVEKDVIIQEKEKLYVELKNLLARQPGPEVAE